MILDILFLIIIIYIIIGIIIFLYTHFLLKDLEYFKMIDAENKFQFFVYIILFWLPLIFRNRF